MRPSHSSIILSEFIKFIMFSIDKTYNIYYNYK